MRKYFADTPIEEIRKSWEALNHLDKNGPLVKDVFELEFDLYPPVQICLFVKNAHSFSNYEIVYPEDQISPQVFESGYLG